MNLSITVTGTLEQAKGHLYIYDPHAASEDNLGVTFNGTPEEVMTDLTNALAAWLAPAVQPMAAGSHEAAS